MALVTESRHGKWSSARVFVLALVGIAVGVGNLWGFPTLANDNGGGAFVVVYLVALATIGLPLLMAEILIGRAGRLSPVNTARRLTHLARRNALWIGVGWFGSYAGLLVLAYLAVFAGWAMYYIGVTAVGSLAGRDIAAASALFGTFTASAWRVVIGQTLFIAATVAVARRGIAFVELMVRRLMPVVLGSFVVLTVFGIVAGEPGPAMHYLFAPRWQDLHLAGVLIALGQAIFTIGIALGAIMAYAAYLPMQISIPRAAAAALVIDALVTVGAGCITVPLLFASGIDADGGVAALFVATPWALAQLPLGAAAGVVLFALIVLVGIVAAVALLEPLLAYLIEEYNANRSRAAVSLGVIAWLIGLACVFSFGSDQPLVAGRTFFELVVTLVHGALLPLGALGIALYVDFVVSHAARETHMPLSRGAAWLWIWWLRVIVPLALLGLFAGALLQQYL
jgi:neurotransmitter:Na+ symporter, NSS family